MENENIAAQNNPLKKFFRQPKLYIKLPSSGNFYPPGSLIKTENDEYPVYAMTAKDEIMMKTPDALLNGQSTVEIIQSCVPNIKNGWLVPSIDIDALLIAIRIATYGENLEVDVTIPNTDIHKTYTTDLRVNLGNLLEAVFDPVIQISPDLIIHIRPLNYLEFSKNAIKTIEEQKIFNIVNDDSVSEEAKLEMFNESFRKLTDINIGMVSQCIVKIVTADGEVSNAEFIKEFIDNADREFFTGIVKHLEIQRDNFSLPPFKISATPDEIEQGAPEDFEVPITLDASNFFA